MRRVEGEVQHVQCEACSARFPTFVFSGDSDMATAGLEAATSVEPPLLVLGTLNPDELRADYAEGRQQFADRMSRHLEQKVVALSVARWSPRSSANGISFQQFREEYQPPQPVYRCPKCGGDAAVAARQTPSAFIAQGGRLELTEDIIL